MHVHVPYPKFSSIPIDTYSQFIVVYTAVKCFRLISSEIGLNQISMHK